jgi:hypothetical protein
LTRFDHVEFAVSPAGKEYGKDASKEAYAALMESGLTFIDTAEVWHILACSTLSPYSSSNNSSSGWVATAAGPRAAVAATLEVICFLRKI